jgi:hypothetical protein
VNYIYIPDEDLLPDPEFVPVRVVTMTSIKRLRVLHDTTLTRMTGKNARGQALTPSLATADRLMRMRRLYARAVATRRQMTLGF